MVRKSCSGWRAVKVLAELLIFAACSIQTGVAENVIFDRQFMESMGITESGEARYVQDICFIEDVCYAYLDDMSVYAYDDQGSLKKLCVLPSAPENFYSRVEVLGDEEIEQLNHTVTYIAGGKDGLYGYNVFCGRIGRIDESGIHWREQGLDFQCLNPEGDFFPNRIARSFMSEQRLYTLVSLESMEDEDAYAFYGFDLDTGKAQRFEVHGIVNICQMEEDRFLALTCVEGAYGLTQLDAETNTLSEIGLSLEDAARQGQIGGLGCNRKGDRICVASGGWVYESVDGNPFSAVAYLKTDSLLEETAAWAAGENQWAFWLNGVVMCERKENLDHVRLVYQAGSLSFLLRDIFEKEYPDVELVHQVQINNAEELVKTLITKDSSVDVFMVMVDHDFLSLLQKELAADLSGSLLLTEDVKEMYPEIRNVLLDEGGRLRAYPAGLYLWQYRLNQGFWEMFFAGRPIPETLEEVLDCWIEWEENDAQAYPDIEFVSQFDYAEWCQEIVQFYVRQYDENGCLPDQNMGRLKTALEKLARIAEIRREEGRNLCISGEGEGEAPGEIWKMTWREAMNEYPTVTVALPQDYLYGIRKDMFTEIELSFGEGDPKRTSGVLYAYIVNPYSRHIDEAIQFIECAASYPMSQIYTYYSTHPAVNEPCERPNYEKTIARYVDERNELERAIEEYREKDVDTGVLEGKLAYVNDWLETKEQQRFLISGESIRAYRERLEETGLSLYTESYYIGDAENSVQRMIQTLCERYASGQLTLDAFLKEMNDKMNMIQAEGL